MSQHCICAVYCTFMQHVLLLLAVVLDLGSNTVIVTDSWIIKTGVHTINVGHQRSSHLVYVISPFTLLCPDISEGAVNPLDCIILKWLTSLFFLHCYPCTVNLYVGKFVML